MNASLRRLDSFPLVAGWLALIALPSACAKSPSAMTTPPATMDASADAAPAAPPCPADEDLISDFTMDNGVHPVDGRQGGWYTYGDHNGFGLLDPMEGMGVKPDLTVGNPTCSKEGSLHVTAKNFTDWGAATGVDFKLPVTLDGGGTGKGTYDASKYRGISFWAKAAAPIKFASVKFTDPYTEIPSVLGDAMSCLSKPMDPKNCSPYLVKFGYGYTGSNLDAIMADYPSYKDTKIDTTWKQFVVLFADTKQDRYNLGQKSPGDHLDVAHLEGMAIQVNADFTAGATMPKANDFEIWVDDVGFVK